MERDVEERKSSVSFAATERKFSSSFKEDEKMMEFITHGLEASWRSSSFNDVKLKKEKVRLDVFVSDPVLIDPFVFSLWVEGYTAKDAALRRKALSSGTPFDGKLFPKLISQDTYDQYRNFAILEKMLENPELFDIESQLIVQIDPAIFQTLLDQYYSLGSDEFLREIVGKKLRPRLRSNLDDIADKLKIPIKKCRRMFDNLRRMYSLIMEYKREGGANGTISEVLQEKFKISQELADKYSHYIFLSYHRIETTDKRLKKLTATDFEYFAAVLMSQWTGDKFRLDLDRGFKDDIRDLKTYLLGDKSILGTYKKLVFDHMKGVSQKALQAFESKFTQTIKSILKIGAGISKSKEFEDILEDLAEKLVENMVSLKHTQVNEFFKAIGGTIGALLDTLGYTRHRQKVEKSWQRFLEGIRLCIMHMLSVSEKLSQTSTTKSSSKETLKESK